MGGVLLVSDPVQGIIAPVVIVLIKAILSGRRARQDRGHFNMWHQHQRVDQDLGSRIVLSIALGLETDLYRVQFTLLQTHFGQSYHLSFVVVQPEGMTLLQVRVRTGARTLRLVGIRTDEGDIRRIPITTALRSVTNDHVIVHCGRHIDTLEDKVSALGSPDQTRASVRWILFHGGVTSDDGAVSISVTAEGVLWHLSLIDPLKRWHVMVLQGTGAGTTRHERTALALASNNVTVVVQ